MAYGKKYKLTAATKNDKISIVEIWELDYVDTTVIEYPIVYIDLQYIPKSDFVYESIIASQMNLTIDVTDDITDMPNLTDLNDRKYWVKLFIDGTQEWSGYVLSDNVTFSFTTGRKHLSFNAIDGLGMLESIRFNPEELSSSPYYAPVVLIWIIKKTLSQIKNFQLNIHTICSYYSSGMTTRATDSAADLFTQACFPLNNFLLSDGVTFDNCLSVLDNLLKSIGCRLFQAKNKWYIIAVNEFANETVYFTEYTYLGIVADSGTEDTHSVIEPFDGNTSGMYFVDNSQIKIFRKGYNNFNWELPLKYADNYVPNANLKAITAGVPDMWLPGVSGFGASVTLNTTSYDSKNIFVLNSGSGGGSRYARVTATVPTALQNDKIDFSLTVYYAQLSTIRGRIYLAVTAAGGSPIYYYNKDGFWQNNASPPANNYYEIAPIDNTVANDVSFTTPPLPVSGQLELYYEINENVLYTQNSKVGNFKLTFNSPVNSTKISSINSTDNQYSLTIDAPYGYPVYVNDGINRYFNNQALGTFYTYVTGPYPTYVACNGWFRYGKATEAFQGLIQLIFKQYINSFRRNLKNIDSSIFGVNTSNGVYSMAKMLKFTDTDPAQINVEDLSYMAGNTSINIVNSEIKGTFLDISDVEIAAEITTIFDVIATPPATQNIQIRNNSGDGILNNVYSLYGSFYSITSGAFPLLDGYEIFGIQTGWNTRIDVEITAATSDLYVSLYINTVLQEQILVPANAALADYVFNATGAYSFTSADQVYITYN